MHTLRLPSGHEFSDDPARLDRAYILASLATAYWTQGRPPGLIERSWAHSLGVGLYAPDGPQCGFARLITDRAMRAHLADVFIDPACRGQGLGHALMAAILDHPDLATVRVWTLQTRDAHGLYARFGFQASTPDTHAMILRRDVPPLPSPQA